MTLPREREIDNVPHLGSGKALRGWDATKLVFLWQIEPGKRYNCLDCGEIISEAAPHTFIRYLFPDGKGYDHHHVHTQCARDNWLEPHGRLVNLEVIHKAQVPLKRRSRRD